MKKQIIKPNGAKPISHRTNALVRWETIYIYKKQFYFINYIHSSS